MGISLASTSALVVLAMAGCSPQSLRLALESQRRADAVQQTVFARQHQALCILLYRDLLRRLAESGVELTPARRAAIGAAWNDRDLVEFWSWQYERARALRMIGVDGRLFSQQSTAELLWKYATAQADRARTGMMEEVAGTCGTGLLSDAAADEEDRHD